MSEFLSSDGYLNAILFAPFVFLGLALLVELAAWAWRRYR